MSERRGPDEAIEPGPGLQAGDFDKWYADMTMSPVKDEIQQRHLTRRVMASATAP